MTISTRLILITLTLCSSQLVSAFDVRFIPATSERLSNESSIIRDPITDLKRLSGQTLSLQHVTTARALESESRAEAASAMDAATATATATNNLNEQPLIGTASDVHYAPQAEQSLIDQLSLLPAADAIYESLPVMPPGKRRLDASTDIDALSSIGRRVYPFSDYTKRSGVRRRDSTNVIVETDSSGQSSAMQRIIDSGGSHESESAQLALPTDNRRDVRTGKRLPRLEGRLLMAAHNAKPNRVRQQQQQLLQQQQQIQRRNQPQNGIARMSAGPMTGHVKRRSSSSQRGGADRAEARVERRSGGVGGSGGVDEDSLDDDDESSSSDDSAEDRSSAFERRSGDDSFEREANSDFNSDAQDQDQRVASGAPVSRTGADSAGRRPRVVHNSGARLRQAASAGGGGGTRNGFVDAGRSSANDDDSGGTDDEDIDASNLRLVGQRFYLSPKRDDGELSLQVEQSVNQKKYPQQVGNLNQVNELQGAAGHHHSHHHGHYYMHAEVPKKKSWKFGFKRGNHKHESK